MQLVDRFRSRFGFLMAATGFAVGLGNIWRFPYITGENGGGAFILTYLLCVICIALPALMAELLIGRRGASIPPESMQLLAESHGASRSWVHAGHLNLLTALFIMTTYAVVGGQVASYLFRGLLGDFSGMDAATAAADFELLRTNVPLMFFWTSLMLGATGFILYRGVNQGIEKAVSIFMPMLLLLMLCLIFYNVFAGGFAEAASYLLKPDFSKPTGDMFLAAVGQAFFSIGVAQAGMMIFGAYLPRSVPIAGVSVLIILIDTCVALLAGFMIFPMVFRFGLDPNIGPGLIFETLPLAFAQMPGSWLIGSVFFLLLSVAAVTSMVGLAEPLVAWVSRRFALPRKPSAILAVGCILPLSFVSVLSGSFIANADQGGFSFNGIVDFLSTQIMLPVGGFLIVLFVGWVLRTSELQEELHMQDGPVFRLWYLLVRFLAPLAIAVILVTGFMQQLGVQQLGG